MDENQIIEMNEFILPDDYEEVEDTTEAEEVVEEVEEVEVEVKEETTEEVTEETKQALEDLEIKYLHEVMKLKDFTPNELKTLVQKGMNHDRLAEKVTLANERNEQVKELATLYNMTEADMLDALLNNYYDSQADAQGKTKEEIKKNHEATKKQTSQKMYERFADKFPDVKGEMIPEEVWNAVKGGDDLTMAYTDYIKDTELKTKEQELANLKTKLAELEGKQKSLEHKEQVKKKAVVKSTTGQGQDSEEFDDFLQGLWGK
jgi:hypothetical protein